MRASTAILLGSTMLEATQSNAGDGVTKGCAIQMALKAVGEPVMLEMPNGKTVCNYPAAQNRWGVGLVNRIWEQYDRLGIDEVRNMDKFVDWVRSIEPAEPEEESDGPDPYDFALDSELERERREEIADGAERD